MVTLRRIPKVCATTALERHVRNWINREARERADGASGVYKDLQYGCSSGIVGHLIYYRDTVRFYRRFQREIVEMLKDMLADCDGSIANLFGESWDSTDPLALETTNQNALAWFGFEEAARRVMECAESGE